MDFEPWLNAAWDEEHRRGFHEAGHLEYARYVNPNVQFTINVTGPGEGWTVLDLTGFSTEQRYAVAVAGCLAEAKGMGNHGMIEPTAEDHNAAQQIHDKFESGDVAWQVDVMVGGNSEPSSCNGGDFSFLGDADPDLTLLQDAAADVAAYFNNAHNWLRVRRRAWALAMVNRPEV